MKYEDIPGWFPLLDQYAFQWVLEFQNRTEPPGDVVELGVFKGKSAVHLARFMKFGERFTVCDLFEDVFSSGEVGKDEVAPYVGLSLNEFKQNFLAFHSSLPEIVAGPSSSITKHVAEKGCRFIHIDASHLYEHVAEDVRSARVLLRDSGVVVFDDFRAEHTPGTAAAVWEAVLCHGLRPIFHTSQKMYCTWGDPVPLREEVIRRASLVESCKVSPLQVIRDYPIVRLYWAKRKGQAQSPVQASERIRSAGEVATWRRAASRLRRALKVLWEG